MSGFSGKKWVPLLTWEPLGNPALRIQKPELTFFLVGILWNVPCKYLPMYISGTPGGYPRIVNLFPWECSEIDQQKYECHIDYFPGVEDQKHWRLQQVSVGPKDINLIRNFDMSISFCWPNLVLESTFFEDKVNRLYVSLSDLRTRGYPIHFTQYIGFEVINSRVSIENIRVKEVFI